MAVLIPRYERQVKPIYQGRVDSGRTTASQLNNIASVVQIANALAQNPLVQAGGAKLAQGLSGLPDTLRDVSADLAGQDIPVLSSLAAKAADALGPKEPSIADKTIQGVLDETGIAPVVDARRAEIAKALKANPEARTATRSAYDAATKGIGFDEWSATTGLDPRKAQTAWRLAQQFAPVQATVDSMVGRNPIKTDGVAGTAGDVPAGKSENTKQDERPYRPEFIRALKSTKSYAAALRLADMATTDAERNVALTMVEGLAQPESFSEWIMGKTGARGVREAIGIIADSEATRIKNYKAQTDANRAMYYGRSVDYTKASKDITDPAKAAKDTAIAEWYGAKAVKERETLQFELDKIDSEVEKNFAAARKADAEAGKARRAGNKSVADKQNKLANDFYNKTAGDLNKKIDRLTKANIEITKSVGDASTLTSAQLQRFQPMLNQLAANNTEIEKTHNELAGVREKQAALSGVGTAPVATTPSAPVATTPKVAPERGSKAAVSNLLDELQEP